MCKPDGPTLKGQGEAATEAVVKLAPKLSDILCKLRNGCPCTECVQQPTWSWIRNRLSSCKSQSVFVNGNLSLIRSESDCLVSGLFVYSVAYLILIDIQQKAKQQCFRNVFASEFIINCYLSKNGRRQKNNLYSQYH
jgi:hypothetical protein